MKGRPRRTPGAFEDLLGLLDLVVGVLQLALLAYLVVEPLLLLLPLLHQYVCRLRQVFLMLGIPFQGCLLPCWWALPCGFASSVWNLFVTDIVTCARSTSTAKALPEVGTAAEGISRETSVASEVVVPQQSTLLSILTVLMDITVPIFSF